MLRPGYLSWDRSSTVFLPVDTLCWQAPNGDVAIFLIFYGMESGWEKTGVGFEFSVNFTQDVALPSRKKNPTIWAQERENSLKISHPAQVFPEDKLQKFKVTWNNSEENSFLHFKGNLKSLEVLFLKLKWSK